MLSKAHDSSAEHVVARYRSEVYRFEIVLMIIRHQQTELTGSHTENQASKPDRNQIHNLFVISGSETHHRTYLRRDQEHP